MIDKIINNGGKITVTPRGSIKSTHCFLIENNQIATLSLEMQHGFIKGFYTTNDSCYEITKSPTAKNVLQVNRHGNNIAELTSKFNLKGLLSGSIITRYKHFYSISTKGLFRPSFFLFNHSLYQTLFSINHPNLIRDFTIEVFPSLTNSEEFNALLAISSFRMLATILV